MASLLDAVVSRVPPPAALIDAPFSMCAGVGVGFGVGAFLFRPGMGGAREGRTNTQIPLATIQFPLATRP
jgi:hypothetical protein